MRHKKTIEKFFILILGLSALSFTFAAKTKNLAIAQWKTAEGMSVLYLPQKSVPMVDIGITFFAGSAYDEKHFGIAALTNELMTQGAGPLNNQNLSEALDNLGAILNNDVSKDLATLQLRTLATSPTLENALTLFSLILSKPRFDKAPYQLAKIQQQHALALQQQSPNSVANDALFEALYGTHPYAHPSLGNKKSIDAISLDAVKTFYKNHYVANNATLAIVGDMDLAKAKAFSKALSKALGHKKFNQKLPIAHSKKAQEKHISLASSQTAIRLGMLGIGYDNPNYFPLVVGNYTLGGGGLSSQLALEVREKRGLSYGVYSYFERMKEKGPFLIGLATKTSQKDKALKVTKETLTHFLEKGPSDKELQKAKQYLTGSFPIQLSSNKKLLPILLRMGAYQLPNDYLDTYLANIENVKQSEIKKAFNDVIDLNDLTIITVGK